MLNNNNNRGARFGFGAEVELHVLLTAVCGCHGT